MKKSEEKSQLEAPVRLTPEQLEIVAAGFAKQLPLVKGGGTILTGAVSPMQQMQQFLKML
jgi:hypothetical protein